MEDVSWHASWHAGNEAISQRTSPGIPDRVVVRFRLNSWWSQELSAAGIQRRRMPDWVRQQEERINCARRFGRDPFRYRDIADSGVPVFGREGLPNCRVDPAIREMIERNFRLRDVHLLPSRDGKADILVLIFEIGEGEIFLSPPAAMLIRELIVGVWGFVHVWANPPQENGRVVHTVNCVHWRPDNTVPEVICLEFREGLWGGGVRRLAS